jgi:hypothetical protein
MLGASFSVGFVTVPITERITTIENTERRLGRGFGGWFDSGGGGSITRSKSCIVRFARLDTRDKVSWVKESCWLYTDELDAGLCEKFLAFKVDMSKESCPFWTKDINKRLLLLLLVLLLVLLFVSCLFITMNLVLGISGLTASGKTHLSTALGQVLNVPVIHQVSSWYWCCPPLLFSQFLYSYFVSCWGWFFSYFHRFFSCRYYFWYFHFGIKNFFFGIKNWTLKISISS